MARYKGRHEDRVPSVVKVTGGRHRFADLLGRDGVDVNGGWRRYFRSFDETKTRHHVETRQAKVVFALATVVLAAALSVVAPRISDVSWG